MARLQAPITFFFFQQFNNNRKMNKIIKMLLVFIVIMGYGQTVKEFKPLSREDYLVEIRGENDELIAYNIKSNSGEDSISAASLRTSIYRTDISKYWEWKYKELYTASSIRDFPRYAYATNTDMENSSAAWLEEQNLPEAKNNHYCYSYFMLVGWKLRHHKVMEKNPNLRKIVELTFLDLATGEVVKVSEGVDNDDKVWYKGLGEYTEINLYQATGGDIILGGIYEMISKPIEIKQGTWALIPEFDVNLYHNFIEQGRDRSLNIKINKNEKVKNVFNLNPNTGDGRVFQY